jgi:hypothetical protein
MKKGTNLRTVEDLLAWAYRPGYLEDPAHQRQPESPYDRSLNRSTIAWLRDLPRPILPVTLASQFPRIANRLSRFWDSPKMMQECFRELLMDKRGRRKGFPKKVLDELNMLAQYYRALNELPDTDVWKSIPYRKSGDT